MASYVVSPSARKDLIKIWEFIAADKVIEAIQEKCEMLNYHPKMGHVRPDLTRNSVLFWPIYSYLIIYKAEASPLEIVRVLNGNRNLIDLLG